MRPPTAAVWCVIAVALLAQVSARPRDDDLRDYRTVETAASWALPRSATTPAAAQPGYLGVTLEDRKGKVVVTAVAAGSPAASATVKVGDEVVSAYAKVKVGDDVVTLGGKGLSADALGELVRSIGPENELSLGLIRDRKPLLVSPRLAATSRPLQPGARAVLGAELGPVKDGFVVRVVKAGTPAEKAKLKVGDVLVLVDGTPMKGKPTFDALAGRLPGEKVPLDVLRDGKRFEVTVTLASESSGLTTRSRNWDDRIPRLFKRPVYRLAVVCVQFPDMKHLPKVRAADWHNALFSTKKHNSRSATGQTVYGSMNDYYREQSCGAFRVEGKVFGWVTVSRKRGDYANDPNRVALLNEAVDLLLARDGKNALDGYDGLFFLYAGGRYPTRRGALYWPHRATFTHRGQRWAYFISPEGERRMENISVITHEFGHMLGLPDLYARPEVPGQEGAGIWCTMAQGHGDEGKPFHLSAWCKEQLGWLRPVTIDPRTKQRLVLSPVVGAAKECFKVMIRADGSEYLLLENRARRGFDRDLPGEGLLIWRVVDGHPTLEESHGIAGPIGPNVHRASVPYPSGSNDSFTPYTTPSSRSKKGGGLPVHITNIRRYPDGRVSFHIGYEYL